MKFFLITVFSGLLSYSIYSYAIINYGNSMNYSDPLTTIIDGPNSVNRLIIQLSDKKNEIKDLKKKVIDCMDSSDTVSIEDYNTRVLTKDEIRKLQYIQMKNLETLIQVAAEQSPEILKMYGISN